MARPTVAEKKHMNAVAQLPCILCGDWPVDVHHAGTGAGGRKNHMKVLPLCYLHHRGACGIHTIGRKVWREIFGHEDELLDRVQKQLDYGAWM